MSAPDPIAVAHVALTEALNPTQTPASQTAHALTALAAAVLALAQAPSRTEGPCSSTTT